MKRMLLGRDSIARKIEMLPINVVHRSAAQVNLAAAEAGVACVARAIEWLRAVASSTSAETVLRRRHHPH